MPMGFDEEGGGLSFFFVFVCLFACGASEVAMRVDGRFGRWEKPFCNVACRGGL